MLFYCPDRVLDILKVLALSVVIQFLNFLMVIILAYAMGENIPLTALLVFLPIIITVTTLPISISGLGIREGGFVILLGLIGIKPEVATTLSLAWFFAIFVGSLLGLVAYMKRTDNTA